jgi:hypothetical protein
MRTFSFGGAPHARGRVLLAAALLGLFVAGNAAAQPPADATRGDKMRALHDAMSRRRLGSQQGVTEALPERVAEAENLVSSGRLDEAIALLTATVEAPSFDANADSSAGRAALYLLGHALASAGIHDSARAYLRKSFAKGWGSESPRAVRRLVEIALERHAYDAGLQDLATVPASAPPETQAEISYLRGRARQAAGDIDGALAEYAKLPQTSRFWSQATYLSGLMQVERGRFKEGEALFCKVADPNRQDKSVPVFADERFFAVRDLARLALGRVAHEQLRHDDARYYYYLVPRDSDRLAEALYEAATTRYEKKDYIGARDLLDELFGLKSHHRYEDEARILDAYIDLALCRFPSADKKLKAFLTDYEPVRDATRRLAENERGTRALLAAARTGADAGGSDATNAAVSTDQLRAVAALVRIDPAYGEIAKKHAVLDHEMSGLKLALGTINDMQRSIASPQDVKAAAVTESAPTDKAAETRAALDGLRKQVDELEQAGGNVAPMKAELAALEARYQAASSALPSTAAGAGADLPDLLKNEAAAGASMSQQLDGVRTELIAAETVLAKDALHRLDLRLSRLLRRARLGRIESVLGKKRALEVEIEAINAGYLPKDAVDSLDAARFLRDNEEYWPFEGDDWPDEFVGSEGLK